MKVEEVMNKKVIVAEAPGTRYDVLKLLAKHDISGMPVVNKHNELVGIVTVKDIFRKRDEEQLALIMTKNPITVPQNADIKKAAKILYGQRIHRLPVVRGKKLIGIVTVKDILKIIAKSSIRHSVPVSPCMPIYEDTPLSVALEIINISREYVLPVLNRRARLTGIVTDRDMFKISKIDVKPSVATLGFGDDEDYWSWVGLKNIMKFYYDTAKISLPNILVNKIMIKNVVTSTKATRVPTAAHNMVRCDLNQLPVIDSARKLLGMVYDLDLLKYIIQEK